MAAYMRQYRINNPDWEKAQRIRSARKLLEKNGYTVTLATQEQPETEAQTVKGGDPA